MGLGQQWKCGDRVKSLCRGSAEGEHKCLHARIEKLDLELAISNVPRLPDQLIQPLVGHRAVALFVNDQGEVLAFCPTPGNVDDRDPIPKLAKGLVGKLFGDKGYLSQPLAQHLLVTHGLHLPILTEA